MAWALDPTQATLPVLLVAGIHALSPTAEENLHFLLACALALWLLESGLGLR
jgi:hypothetical protein